MHSIEDRSSPVPPSTGDSAVARPMRQGVIPYSDGIDGPCVKQNGEMTQVERFIDKWKVDRFISNNEDSHSAQ